MPILIEVLLIRLIVAARFWLNEGPTPPGLWYLAGYWLESRKDYTHAAAAYTRALAAADASPNRRMFKIRQKWQFQLERLHHANGNPRVVDPLFDCHTAPHEDCRVQLSRRRRAAGYYRTEWSHRGLRIDGFLARACDRTTVRVLVDGILLRHLTVTRVSLLPPFFQLTISRAAVATLPPASRIRLETADGMPLLNDGCEETDITVPHGSEKMTAASAGIAILDKKGFLISDKHDLLAQQTAFLDIYVRARETFEHEIGKPLMLLYGTLLGQFREGDFIPGDDDFDVGYVSHQESPEAVKCEAQQIVLRLVAAGFTVSFNRGGRLFRLRLPSCHPSTHLDVHTVWFERGAAWIHPRACLSCIKDDFLPPRQAVLRGTEVDIPHRPEAFLRAYYGEDWKTPDPTYSTAARRIPKNITRHLARACVTPAEWIEMQCELENLTKASPTLGRLISIGSYSLYPLDDYDAKCDW